MYTHKIVANALMLRKGQVNHVECSSRFALYIAVKSAIGGGVRTWGPTFSKKESVKRRTVSSTELEASTYRLGRYNCGICPVKLVRARNTGRRCNPSFVT